MKWQQGFIAVLACLSASAANAAIITLDFEGIAPHPNNSDVLINGFYNGGTASNGSSGTNFGVEFSAGATLLCLNTETIICSNTSKGGLGIASSRLNAMFFPLANPIMNVAAGFDTGFSMAYTNPFAENVGIEIWDGLNGTGNLLASALLPGTIDGAGGACSAYGGPNYCPFADFAIAFAGIGRSVVFTGTLDRSTYDDFTFGSTIVGGVPEPGVLTLMGLAIAGLVGVRRVRS